MQPGQGAGAFAVHFDVPLELILGPTKRMLHELKNVGFIQKIQAPRKRS